VLFNRSVHKSVHKGAARAIHAVFINGCTSCTTFVAWDKAMRMRDGVSPIVYCPLSYVE